jgi:hypothetical protein
MHDDWSETGTPERSNAGTVDEARRDALQRIARFGAYTAPALLVMLTSEKAPAQTDLDAPT